MLGEGAALGEVALGEGFQKPLSNSFASTPFAQWVEPYRKPGLSVAIMAAFPTDFVIPPIPSVPDVQFSSFDILRATPPKRDLDRPTDVQFHINAPPISPIFSSFDVLRATPPKRDLDVPTQVQYQINLLPAQYEFSSFDVLRATPPKRDLDRPTDIQVPLVTLKPEYSFSSFDVLRATPPKRDLDRPTDIQVRLIPPVPDVQFVSMDLYPRPLGAKRDLDVPTEVQYQINLLPAQYEFTSFEILRSTPPRRQVDTPTEIISTIIVIPPPPNLGIQKIIALDAAYGSEDVYRTFATPVATPVYVGDPVALVMDTGKDMKNPSLITDSGESLPDPQYLVMWITRPDGTTFKVQSPAVYTQQPPVGTSWGVFNTPTFVVCQLSGAQTTQVGFWSCYLQIGNYASVSRRFYIGPLTVV